MRSKLLELGIYGQDLEDIIVSLIEENVLNEERFARSYARGKFSIKHWGRNKIKQALKMRQVSDYCIRKGMEEINETDYEETLVNILLKRKNKLKETDVYLQKKKLAEYAIRNGYETELIWEKLNSLK